MGPENALHHNGPKWRLFLVYRLDLVFGALQVLDSWGIASSVSWLYAYAYEVNRFAKQTFTA